MAADEEQSQLAFLQLLGGTGFEERRVNWELFVAEHELSDEDSKVSPKSFKLLFDEHLIQILKVRNFLLQELNGIWGIYGTLDLSEEAKREEQKRKGEAAVHARIKYDGLIKDIIAVAVEWAQRVHWKKHTKNQYQEELLGWVIQKQARLTGAINDPSNEPIRAELEAVHGCLTPGFETLSIKSEIEAEKSGESTLIRIRTKKVTLDKHPTTTSPPFNPEIQGQESRESEKHSLSDIESDNGNSNNGYDDTAGPTKRQKLSIPVGEWWGPNNSKLSCTDAFFDVVREYKAYIANPTDPPGTADNLRRVVQLIKQALKECGKSDSFSAILMRKEWQFRDKRLKHPNAPTMIQPGVLERHYRLGEKGNRGINYFKQILGGGLTDYEKESTDHWARAQGMLAWAHAATIDDRVGLRGGGYDDEANDEDSPEGLRLKAVREGTGIRFRDPNVLWEQLVEDTSYPGGPLTTRLQEARPLMTSREWIGQPKPMTYFEIMMAAILDHKEWEKIQGEIEIDEAHEMIDGYKKVIQDAKKNIESFKHENEELKWEEPKLNESGGRDKPKLRYGNLRDKDFVKPIGYAFRARMYQTFRLAVTWQAYVAGFSALWELLQEDKALLEIWDVHEELYMEWENWRFFSLSNEMSIAELLNRYNQREVLRKKWAKEIEAIDDAIKNLGNDERYYDAAGEAIMIAQLKSFPNDSGVATLLDSGVLDKVEKDRDVDGHGDVDAMDVDNAHDVNDPPDLDAAQKYLERLITIYQKEVEETIRKNERLDKDDLGNTGVINANNIDIMAKEQMIWALKTEVENMKRSLNPFSEESIGRGVTQKWPTPPDFTKIIAPLPRRPDLPLGVTSLGLGPMPGEHPSPDHPAVLLGCPPGFAEPKTLAQRLKKSQANPTTPMPNTNASSWNNAPSTVTPKSNTNTGPSNKGLSTTAPKSNTNASSWNNAPSTVTLKPNTNTGPSNNALNTTIPKPNTNAAQSNGSGISLTTGSSHAGWPDFLERHRDTWTKDEATGTALLSWDEWVNQAHHALLSGTKTLRTHFEAGSPYKTDESLLRHIREQYKKRFTSTERHDGMAWRQRELGRRALLEIFSRGVNSALRKANQPRTFPKIGTLPPIASKAKLYAKASPEMATASSPANSQATLMKLRQYLKAKNDSELTIRRLTRAQNKGVKLRPKDHEDLARATETKKQVIKAYKSLRAELDAAADTQAEAIEEEENALLDQDIKTAEALVDAGINKNQDTPEPLKNIPAVVATKPLPTPGHVQKASTESKLPDNTAELTKAAEYLAAARVRLHESRHKYNAAITAEEEAEQAAAADSDDAYLKLVYERAKENTANADLEYTDSKLNMRVQAISYQEQEVWQSNPHETLEQLKARHDNLNRPFEEWKADIAWDDKGFADRPTFVNTHWILEVITMMHEAWKAVSVNPGAAYFSSMHDHFWRTPGDTIAKKRGIWLWEVIKDFNERTSGGGCCDGQFVALGPQPPLDWYKGRMPPRQELLALAEAEYEAAEAQKNVSFHGATVEDITDEGEEGNALQQFALFSKMEKPSPSSAQRDRELRERLQAIKMRSQSPAELLTPGTPSTPTPSIFATHGIVSKSKKLIPTSHKKKLTGSTSVSGGEKKKPSGIRLRLDKILNLGPRTGKPQEWSSPTSPPPFFLSSKTPTPSAGFPPPPLPLTAIDKEIKMEYNDTPSPSPSPSPPRYKAQTPDIKMEDTGTPPMSAYYPPPYSSAYTQGRRLPPPEDDNALFKSIASTPIKTEASSEYDQPIPTPLKSAGLWGSGADEDEEDAQMVDADGQSGSSSANGGMNDAWPDLKDMITGFWIAVITYEALREKKGDFSGISRATHHPDWPRPVRVDSATDGVYYCL